MREKKIELKIALKIVLKIELKIVLKIVIKNVLKISLKIELKIVLKSWQWIKQWSDWYFHVAYRNENRSIKKLWYLSSKSTVHIKNCNTFATTRQLMKIENQK